MDSSSENEDNIYGKMDEHGISHKDIINALLNNKEITVKQVTDTIDKIIVDKAEKQQQCRHMFNNNYRDTLVCIYCGYEYYCATCYSALSDSSEHHTDNFCYVKFECWECHRSMELAACRTCKRIDCYCGCKCGCTC